MIARIRIWHRQSVNGARTFSRTNLPMALSNLYQRSSDAARSALQLQAKGGSLGWPHARSFRSTGLQSLTSR
jgi:hypothetical protein